MGSAKNIVFCIFPVKLNNYERSIMVSYDSPAGQQELRTVISLEVATEYKKSGNETGCIISLSNSILLAELSNMSTTKPLERP